MVQQEKTQKRGVCPQIRRREPKEESQTPTTGVRAMLAHTDSHGGQPGEPLYNPLRNHRNVGSRVLTRGICFLASARKEYNPVRACRGDYPSWVFPPALKVGSASVPEDHHHNMW